MFLKLGFLILTIVFVSPPCHAAFVLGFSVDAGQTFSSSVTVNPGDLVVFDIYARELNTNDTLSTEGLINMGTRATFNVEYGSVSSVTIANSLFNFLPDADFDNDLGELNFTAGALDPVSGSNILLGRVEFLAEMPGTTEFSFGDWDPFFADMVSGGGVDLDPMFFNAQFTGTHQFSVTAVPEPSSLLFCGLGLSIVLFKRRRRSSRKPMTCT